jgi:hypothetical protein
LKSTKPAHLCRRALATFWCARRGSLRMEVRPLPGGVGRGSHRADWPIKPGSSFALAGGLVSAVPHRRSALLSAVPRQ